VDLVEKRSPLDFALWKAAKGTHASISIVSTTSQKENPFGHHLGEMAGQAGI
jgi:hypothetical protein